MAFLRLADCYPCGKPFAEVTPRGAKIGDRWLSLCPTCWAKVAREGRTPRQVIEAILIYHCEDDVGGPHDPLDREDYRDLELLGLWPEAN